MRATLAHFLSKMGLKRPGGPSSEVYALKAPIWLLHITLLAIQQFNSEEEFRKQVIQFFKKGAILEGKTLIIQIDGSEEKSRNLIESAR